MYICENIIPYITVYIYNSFRKILNKCRKFNEKNK